MSLRKTLARHFPAIGIYKRVAVAARDSLAAKTTYAQHGEDVRAIELLDQFDLSEGRYVDVGANHPTDISNTYLLYRRGLSGIIVEPNTELARLFKWFRPRDTTVAVGCSDTPGLANFSISKTPVLSSLDAGSAGDVWRTVRVPVLTLDLLVASLEPAWIPFLSVDVEGHAGAVLRGAEKTLRQTYLVCVEASPETVEETEVLAALDAADFQIVERRDCNILALNRDDAAFRRFVRRTSADTASRARFSS